MKRLFLVFSIFCFLDLEAQNNALDFDGTNDFVIVNDNNSLDITGSITIEAWIKPDINTPEKTILIKGTSNQCMNYGLCLKNGNLAYLSGGDCGWNGRGVNSIIQTGVWQHVAAVGSGNNLKLYINGLLTDNITLANSLGATNNQPLWIGNSTAGLVNYLDMSVDEIRIWNIGRSASDIADNMNKEIDSASAGLVAYYKFNQGVAGGNNASETILYDCTANSNNGTLMNFTLSGSSSNWIGSGLTLPVNLIEFSGSSKQNRIELKWTTNEEINNQRFEIERSLNGQDWFEIGSILGEGTSTGLNHYEYTDYNRASGINYYRLKQIDLDDTFTFSKIITVTSITETTDDFRILNNDRVKLYPNPNDGKFTVSVEGEEVKSVQVINILGKEEVFLTGEIETNLSGILILKMETNKNVILKKVSIK